jgi:GMP reductase
MEKALKYDDVALLPDNYSDLETRDDADVSVAFLGKTYSNPVICANMASVVNVDVCRKLDLHNYFYIMHRFGYLMGDAAIGAENCIGLSVTQGLVRVANEENWNLVSISTGVNDDSLNDLKFIKKHGFRVDVITVDVALGFHKKVADRIQIIRDMFPKVKIIAGNVAGPKACEFLIEKCKADAIKLGIGQGSVCSTRLQTGFTAPMVWTIEQCYRACVGSPVPLIADGGLKHIGDIAKAIRFGATMVMSGGLFAGCYDSAAETTAEGKKQYYGSASVQCKKHSKHIEGYKVGLDEEGCIIDKMNAINQALQSSISYSGGRTLFDIRKTEYILV